MLGTSPMSKKDALLLAAKELFCCHGYAETTFKKISEQADVALGLLAHHYGTKEKLFFTAGMDVLENIFRNVEQKSQEGTNGLEKVLLFCRAYLDFSIAEGSHYRLLIRCSPYSVTSNEYRMSLHQGFERMHLLLESLIQQGIDDGSVTSAAPSVTTQVVMGTLVGGCRTQLLTPFSFPSLYGSIIEFIRNALATPVAKK